LESRCGWKDLGSLLIKVTHCYAPDAERELLRRFSVHGIGVKV